MPYDGFGNFTRDYNWTADKLAAIKIQSARMDAEFDNYAAALNQVVLRSGVTAFSGDIKVGGNKITGVGAGAAATPSIQYSADATTGIYFPAAGQFGITAAGVLRFACTSVGAYIPSGQSFGVGTTTPRTALDIAGIGSIRTMFEDATLSATALTGTVHVDAKTQAVVVYSADAVANWSFNIRGDGVTTLDSIMAVGQAATFGIEVPQGVTAYYCTTITVDGAAVSQLKWFGGTAPAAGNPSGIDVYSITVIKTGAGTFKVRASQIQVA